MPEIEDVIAAQRQRVLGRIEGPMVRDLLIDYSRVRAMVEREARALAVAMEGAEATPAQIIRSRRLDTLLRQVDNEMRVLTGREAVRIERATALAVEAGTADAMALATSVAAAPSALTVPAAERVVGALQRGSALRALVDEVPAAARAAVRNALVDGIIRGANPRVTARAVGKALGGQTARALTIARTETMRAYRGAALEMYRANDGVVLRWIWISARDRRTCPVCWAMHGTKHPLDQLMATHPNCRCSQGPDVSGPDAPVIMPGPDRFDALPEATQEAILGPAKFRAYKDGAFALPAIVRTGRDPRWGPYRAERSLASLVGPVRARGYIMEAMRG